MGSQNTKLQTTPASSANQTTNNDPLRIGDNYDDPEPLRPNDPVVSQRGGASKGKKRKTVSKSRKNRRRTKKVAQKKRR